MKILIAPDKFKGSLTGMEFCDAVERGIGKHISDIEIIKLPLADGGDGTIEVLSHYLKGERVNVKVNDPLQRTITASYLYSESKKTAYIEIAEASGIRLLKGYEANPMKTSTYGTGELIRDALNKNVKKIIMGIGGSATNDAGLGLARALGFQFFDKENSSLEGKGEDLNRLNRIDVSAAHPKLKQVRFEVACDVTNPLYGKNGAACVYSQQKGASPEMVAQLDSGLKNFNEVVNKQFAIDLQKIKGSGAGGGLGAACILFLQAKLTLGIELVKNIADFTRHLQNVDWVITGEGKLDEQTFSGKLIKGVQDSLTDEKLAVFCGFADIGEDRLKQSKINYIAEVSKHATGMQDSIANAGIYLEKSAEEFAIKFLR